MSRRVPYSSLTIPTTLQDSLMARLDRLVTAKGVAQYAAVIGRQFSYELLQAVSQLDETMLQHELGRLVEAELVYQRGLPPQATYLFKHALIQDTAYASLLKSSRQQYHQRIAQVLAVQFPEMVETQPELVAYHYTEAGLKEQAIPYWQRAGQALTLRCANQEAVTCFEQALQALRYVPESQHRLEREIDLLLALRGVLFPLRELHRVLTCLQEAETLAERLQDHRRLGRVLCFQGLLLWATRQPQQGIAVGRRALAMARQHQDIAVASVSRDVLCRIHCYLGDYPRALSLCSENIDVLIGDLERESFGMAGFQSVHARRWYAEICAETGLFAEGQKRADEAVMIAGAATHAHTLIAAYYGAGILHFRRGNAQGAAVILEQALSLSLKEDIRVFLVQIKSILGAVYALMGRTSEALELQEQTVELHEFDISRCLRLLGQTYLQLGRVKEARSKAELGINLAKEAHESGFLAEGLWLLGEITKHGKAPDTAAAGAYYQQALTLADELGMRPLQAHCHRGLGTLYSQTGQPEQARAELSTAIDMYRDMEMTFWLPETEEALAEVEGKA